MTHNPAADTPLRSAVANAAATACRRIAPSWPLDRFVAVNPYWGWTAQPIETVDARLAHLGGSSLRMSRNFYRSAWQRDTIRYQDLRTAIQEAGRDDEPDELVAALDDPEPVVQRLPMLSDLHDRRRDLSHQPAWGDAITQQVSQFCAKFFDNDQAEWPPSPRSGLYIDWLEAMKHNRAIGVLMGTDAIRRGAWQLPGDPRILIDTAVDALGLSDAQLEDLFTAALLRINGWAAWCAYRDWHDQEASAEVAWRNELLAIRLAWELLLDDGERGPGSVWSEWQRAWQHAEPPEPDHAMWLWQRALEIAYQRPLANELAAQGPLDQPATPSAQAVFCIDVRSELIRRALEASEPSIQTIGFAGFFGVPAVYQPAGTANRIPMLPGLLSPSLEITDTCGQAAADEALAHERHEHLAAHSNQRPFHRLPASAFTLVETMGLRYLLPLIKRSLAPRTARQTATQAALGSSAQAARPRLRIPDNDIERKLDLTAGALTGMGLTRQFARLVVLIGHGSQSANNPHASGLDCGACSGQGGETNARALAALLNEPAVREGLAERGWSIPETTHFAAGLHNTTTDEVTVLDTDEVPATHDGDLAQFQQALGAAGDRSRAERAPALGLGHLAHSPRRLRRALYRRANDWAQTRPEWGLADNASLIVAPRARTRRLDLGGRAFLHEYDCRRDPDGAVLETIMTAPMIVAQWINMQYFASTLDHRRYGSGNKVLHNVVAGRIGVFEGNAGDLRIGLAHQSLHDGEQWRHTPRRLGVYIEAPRAAIDRIVGAHELVHQLATNGWLQILRIDPDTGAVEAYGVAGWHRWVEPEA